MAIPYRLYFSGIAQYYRLVYLSRTLLLEKAITHERQEILLSLCFKYSALKGELVKG